MEQVFFAPCAVRHQPSRLEVNSTDLHFLQNRKQTAKTAPTTARATPIPPARIGVSRENEAQVNFIATRRNRSSSTSASHDSVPDDQVLELQTSGRQNSAMERTTPSEGHSFAETAIQGRSGAV